MSQPEEDWQMMPFESFRQIKLVSFTVSTNPTQQLVLFLVKLYTSQNGIIDTEWHN